MNKYTNEQIVEKCREIWRAECERHYEMSCGDEKFDVVENSPERVRIEISAQYEAPNLNLYILKDLADFFGTMNINDDEKFGMTGCETCDYGSSYGYTLTVRPEHAA